MSERSAPSHRRDYAVFRAIQTRWMDNDIYGHMNNVVHYSLFDTAVNGWLIEEGLVDPAKSERIGLVVETGCRYFAEMSFPDQDALNLYAAGRALLLDRAWNFMPNHDHVSAPKLIHWAGPTKPWGDGYMLGQATYEAYAAKAAARMEAAGGE